MGKIFRFFVDVKNELVKVVWPTRAEAIRYTLIVIIFSVTIAFILGLTDYGLLRLFETIV